MFSSFRFLYIFYLFIGFSKPVHALDNDWSDVIKILNQQSGVNEANLNIDTDLLKLYKNELESISSDWIHLISHSQDKYSADKKNTFFLEQVRSRNKKFLEEVEKFSAEESKVSNEQIFQEVFSKAKKYNFIKSKDSKNYLLESNIGFCFYKALLVHFLLLKKGIYQQDIKKIFVVGPMISRPIVWKFHVAVAVRSAGKIWIVDPILKSPAPLEEWRNHVLELSAEKPYPRTRFYLSDPRKFLPNSGVYSNTLIHHKKTQKYNPEFLQYLKKESFSE